MSRLFLKLFGTFWLTTVLILAISIFASFRLAGDEDAGRDIDPRETDAVLRGVLDESGLDGLRAWLADRDNFAPGRTVYVVDEAGNELLGRPVPARLARRLDRIRAIASRSEPGAPLVHRRSGRLRGPGPLLQAPDGTRLLAIPGPLPPPRFGVLSSGNLRFIVLALAAVTSLVCFWLLSRSLSRPADRISAAVSRFAAGDLAARVGRDGYSNDEIGEIARQFDRMAGALESQAETRRELFRNVSHELRAPLARLSIATELLERKPAESGQALARIRQEIETLDALTGQVLSLARAAQSAAAGEPLSLADVVRRVARDAELEAAEKGVSLNWTEADDDIRVRGDETLMVSALQNVVRNAVQATPAGGAVEIEARRANRRVSVTVTDSGPGVPEAELERIFEPFYRLDTNRPGSGIGLAITARVMEQIGGSATASIAAAGGLVVTLEMPLA